MIGYILTEAEKNSIQGQQYSPFEIFNCVQNIDGIWFTFLSDDDKRAIIGTQYEWLLACPQGVYVPQIAPPFPPTL
jgi:hypothetical protein